jgi:RNA recognition motif-containing protein
MSTTLYVSNLNEKLSVSKLLRVVLPLFDYYGKVERYSIDPEKSVKRRGQMFITFRNEKAAERAMVALQGRVVEGKEMRIAIAKEPTRNQTEFEKVKKLRVKDSTKHPAKRRKIEPVAERTEVVTDVVEAPVTSTVAADVLPTLPPTTTVAPPPPIKFSLKKKS